MNWINTESIQYKKSEEEESGSLTSSIIGAAIEVHRGLGPGLLESAYEKCLIYELQLKQLKVEQQKALPVFYKDVKIVIEIKSIMSIAPIHEAQLLSYLKLSNYKIGLLINFNVKMLKDGIRRMKS